MPSITLTFSAQQATRLSIALQKALELDAPATGSDLKQYIIEDIRQLVRTAEKQIAEEAAQPQEDLDLT